MKYHNPILKGFYPDPSICDDGQGGYYLVTSSFEYLPAVPLFYSQDLVNWEAVGYCLDRDSQIDLTDTPASGGIFAPTIRRSGDTFYMITTNVTRGVFYVTSKNPRSGWSEPIFLKGLRGIDPSFTFEANTTYVQLAVEGPGHVSCIGQVEIDLATGKILTELKIISFGTGGRDTEAPHIYQKDGYYYLMCAEGGTREAHSVTIQRSRDIWGPYEASQTNPILSNRDQPNETLQAVGHADLIQDAKGNWWCVALAQRPIDLKHVTGRETILLPAKWPTGQWPTIHKGYAEDWIETPLLKAQQVVKNQFVDDFSQSKLSPVWNTIRQFNRQTIRLEHQRLLITGNGETMSTLKSPSFLGLRQTDPAFTFEVALELRETSGEAGLALYLDPWHHVELGIERTATGQKIFVRKQVADLIVVEPAINIEAGLTNLKVTSDGQYYQLAVQQAGTWVTVGQTYCANLATEVGFSHYTGVYLGIYAQAAQQTVAVAQVHYQDNQYFN